MEKLKSQHNAKLIITKNLASQIEVLHSQCPENKEWSGLLLIKILEGSLEDLPNLKISCEQLYLMDFGDATFTSFEAGEDWLKFYELFPQVDPIENPNSHPWYVGKIHSHHQMQSFHSQTDTQDLVENAPKFPFFLSLVVNYKCQPFAEIGVAGEIKETRTLKNIILNQPETKKAYTYIIPCDIAYETDSWLVEQINKIKEKNKSNVQTYYSHEAVDYSNYKYSPCNETKRKVDKEPKSTGSNPKGYKKVLDNLSELFTLGVGTSMTFAQPPAKVLEKINDELSPMDIPKFKSAFKAHFLNWFDEYFALFNDEEEVIGCVEFFLNQEVNKSKWISNIIKTTLDELKKDVNLLRKVQGHTLV